MSKQPTAVDRIMSEVVRYGGLPLRRHDVLTLATEHLGEHAGEPFGAQYFAFRPAALEDVEPYSLEDAREIMGSSSWIRSGQITTTGDRETAGHAIRRTLELLERRERRRALLAGAILAAGVVWILLSAQVTP